MGSCTVVDKSSKEIGQENQFLSDSNIRILKFLSLYYVEKKQSGMAVKMINIRLITKNYYDSVTTERDRAFKAKRLFNSSQCSYLEKILLMETNELKKANRVLNKVFSSLTSNVLSFTPSVDRKLFEYSKNEDVIFRYEELKSRCIEFNHTGPGIKSLAYKINNGVELTQEQKEILNHISQVTSHIANNPERRISYPFQTTSSRRSESISSLMSSKKLDVLIAKRGKKLSTDGSSGSDKCSNLYK